MEMADQLGFQFRPPERRIWTVRALVSAVRSHLEREYSDCWVEGEISNLRIPDSGHLYFTLKEEAAQNWHHHFTAGGGAAGHSEHSGAAASLGQCADLSGAGAGGFGAGRGDGW